MKLSPCARQFEFFHPHPYNFQLVQSEGEEVTIYAAFDNFSERRKSMFIRELAAEGFIPDCYERFSSLDGAFRGVSWVIDGSWVKVNERIKRWADRLCARLLFAASLVLLILAAIILPGGGHATGNGVNTVPTGEVSQARGHTQVGRIDMRQGDDQTANAKDTFRR
jgi:hypothetical protein